MSLYKEPNSYKEAIASPKANSQLNTIKKEVKELEKLNIQTLVPRPPKSRPVLKGKWVYKLKLHPNGTIDKYKARWVAKGFLQRYRINVFETFTGTVRPTAYRLAIAIAINLGYTVYHWDMKSAFPNADIDAEIYVEQLEGMEGINNIYIYLLNKALYRLK